ncbi:MAG: hypothetical protein KatS3mg001_312 [Candidatus Pacearchaeota archaeon]|nr:MAG: hypothetical protein KatS3mg001_312 [Candidatus Pacearchaeota archaeon]
MEFLKKDFEEEKVEIKEILKRIKTRNFSGTHRNWQ